MSKRKHSYVPFYMDDWLAATAHMPRPVWAVLFQICLYNWDKMEPVPPPRLKIMLADTEGQGEEIVNALVASGSLQVDQRGVFSARAISEAEKAFDLWMKKSRGGKNSKGGDNSDGDSGTPERVLEQSSKTPGAEPDPEPEPDSKERQDSENSEWDCRSVVEAWNEMARRNGLKQVSKMTGERIGRLAQRVDEHGGVRAVLAGINLIPEYPFLLGGGESGWKATFDWLLKPDSLVRLIEGSYEPRAGSEPKSTGGPSNAEQAEKANERLGEMGSTMRWRLEGKEWVLKPGSAK